MTIVAVIPARGGSKGIPDKNIAMCAGRPLIAYTANSANKSQLIDRIIVSTDSDRIASVAAGLGLEVPFKRPSDLASDAAGSLSVLAHALDWLEDNGVQVEALVLLQPTSPCRESRHIDDAIALFRRAKADTVVSVVEVPHQYHPDKLLKIESGVLISALSANSTAIRPRQESQPIYARNGPAIVVIGPQQVRRGSFYSGRTIPYIMSTACSIDIDTPEDLRRAEIALSSFQ